MPADPFNSEPEVVKQTGTMQAGRDRDERAGRGWQGYGTGMPDQMLQLTPEMVVSGTGQILGCHLVWVEGNLDKSSFMEQWEHKLNWGGLKGERGSERRNKYR